MLLKRLLCLFDKHAPKRSTTYWDGMSYVGDCRHCGRSIRRAARHKWRRAANIGPAPAQMEGATTPAEPHS